MTIVNLFRRYKRWNPVHPTYGAFWGLGIGLGCGIGWGPGFGPEVVGYVGSGCGVGLSVGVTLVGLGVGLPASGLTCLPFNAIVWTGQGVTTITSTTVIPAVMFAAKQSWYSLSVQSLAIQHSLQRDFDYLSRNWRGLQDPNIWTRKGLETSGSHSHYNRQNQIKQLGEERKVNDSPQDVSVSKSKPDPSS